MWHSRPTIGTSGALCEEGRNNLRSCLQSGLLLLPYTQLFLSQYARIGGSCSQFKHFKAVQAAQLCVGSFIVACAWRALVCCFDSS